MQNGPEPSRGAPLLGAAKRTLDGEDRSEMIRQEGKKGERVGAILAPFLTATDSVLGYVVGEASEALRNRKGESTDRPSRERWSKARTRRSGR